MKIDQRSYNQFLAKFQVYLFLAIASLFLSCQSTKVEELPALDQVTLNNDSLITIQIPGSASELTSKMNFIDIVNDVVVVPLETNDQCLIGEIYNILFDDDKIFVIDRYSAEGVFVFTRQGKFIASVNDKGEGPEQFHSIYDVALDKKKKQIIILDLENPSLITYDYSGNFIKKKAINIYFNSFKVSDSGRLFMNIPMGRVRNPETINNYLFMSGSLDSLGIIYNKGLYLGDERNLASVATPLPFIESAEGICYAPGYYDTLYSVKDDGLKGIFSFSFKKDGFNIKESYMFNSDEFIKKINTSNIVEHSQLNLRDYLVFNVSFKNERRKLVYDKRKSQLNEIVLFSPKIEYFPILSPYNFYESSDRFVSFSTAIELKRSIEKMKNNDTDKSDLILPEIDDFDNPILFFYTLK